ncbi:hypothetical protein [Frigoriglobus tundricola]|uniref:SprT-like domain-containing protein n=1 Tax=Frigoriglobus tundricola TaxID=2774151 RepID=A0A6M5YJQ0_9BACT|nr:hypothetical protein [Frigoriglobus tundricola]QJW94185.1 hypothetical protein FTUN_1704 [Frigoriglobus tundricola]
MQPPLPSSNTAPDGASARTTPAALEEPAGAVSGLNRKDAIAKPVYPALAAHQRAEEEWALHPVAVELDVWWTRLDGAFGLDIPRTPLRLEKDTRRNCFGYFRPGHNELGLKLEIALALDPHTDEAGLDWGELIGTLLHESGHLWQHLHGQQQSGTYGHHNKELRDRLRSCGLLVDYRGHQTYAPSSPFLDLLARYGVAPPRTMARPDGAPARKAGRSRKVQKLRKWSCGCQNARVGTRQFVASCGVCDRRFLPAV